MNRHEEIFLILKRIPEQIEYINELFDRLYIIGNIPSPYAANWYTQTQIEKKKRLVNEETGLIPSAEGVLFNLVNRLNELVNGENDNDSRVGIQAIEEKS